MTIGSRVLATLLAFPLAAAAGCAPDYVALPLPVPQTRGATPVPGDGFGAGIEFGDGLTGRGLDRKELLHLYLTLGVEDRASFSLGAYGGLEQYDPGGAAISGKVRLGSPLGDGTNTAVRLGVAFTERSATSQNDAMTVLDAALPSEWLAGRTGESTFYSIYGGPRVLWQDYRDHDEPGTSSSDLLPGALGGAHLAVGHLHVFGEGTVAWLPEQSGPGGSGGGSVFLPSAGVVAHFGSPFGWDR